jgi:LPS sulfotransferase NodH
MRKPTASVFICAVPRSGSSLLAQKLFQSGVVGWPGEWFWREEMERHRAAWEVTTWRDYLDRALDAGTSANGVFAAKLMWAHLHDLLFELRRLACEYDANDLSVLRSFFPQLRFVWVQREDVVAQAVSWAKAVQTGQWASFQDAEREPSFDFDQIDALYHAVRVYDGAGKRWFAEHEIEPLRIAYEELAASDAGVTADVLSLLGLEPLPGAPLSVDLELTKQADATNQEWADRYRQLAQLQNPMDGGGSSIL